MAIIAIMIACSRSKADDATKHRFLNEYPAASKFLTERFRNVRCSFETRHLSCASILEKKNEFRKSGSFEKIESFRLFKFDRTHKGIESRQIIVMRDRPLFSLELEPGMKAYFDTRLLVSNPVVELVRCIRNSKTMRLAISKYYERMTTYGWASRTAREFEYECGEYVYAPWGCGPSQIERFMAEPTFDLIDAHADPDEPGIVEIRFRRMSGQGMIEHVVRFDTNNHWAVTSMMTSPVKTPAIQVRTTVRYGPPIDGVAWPEVVEKNLAPTAQFTHWTFEPTPLNEFRRSHYGLQDPWIDWSEPRVQAIAGLALLAFPIASLKAMRKWRKRRFARGAMKFDDSKLAEPSLSA